MSKLIRLLPPVALLFLFASSALADTLQVSFMATFPDNGIFINNETVSASGSFHWNTATNTVYDVSVTGTGPLSFGPSVTISAHFVPPPGFSACGDSVVPFYPAGTMHDFVILDNTGTGIQMDLGFHGDCDTPVVPSPGFYPHEPFLLVVPGFAPFFSMVPDPVTVTGVPEPGVTTLLSFALLALAAAVHTKTLCLDPGAKIMTTKRPPSIP